MDTQELCHADPEQEFTAGVRLVVLNLPEDEGEGLGFRLTRTLWDPYPWIHEVTPESRADIAGLKTGDCLLQADGKDLLGLTIGKVAGLIRGDGEGHGVSLLVWNCGVDPSDDPELLWSCGGGSRGERSRRALAGVVKALSCCVCAATATKALNCARSHLYCEGCWSRLQRCALCRESLPAKDSPYARNLVAEQVFEAIATEYELKNTLKNTKATSAHTSPTRSPNISPSSSRKGQYQLSVMQRNRKAIQNSLNNEKFASDPNINRHKNSITNMTQRQINNGGKCRCQNELTVPQTTEGNLCSCQIQHKLVARLRQACSLADLQNGPVQSSTLSKSLSNINSNDQSNTTGQQSNSMDSLKHLDAPVFVLSPPPIYVLACEHSK
ncbi:unnamed protein product, partial [Brenthis ino]